ncbi:serine/threonine-protein kinase [Archangium sp.]|uniref:serine/threonine protein kinase n=1 Tax=Archangium sp. TaxID=1872627 RepID=UPI00286CE17D|nr:serine/threonine-protein kinase [Archangium sp.]
MRPFVPPPPTLGEWVGEYQVVAKLGEGGGGIVFKVRKGTRFYALKLFHGARGGKDGREVWGRREVSSLLRVRHPHVVRLVATGYWPDEETGCLYFVMEYVEGRTLFAWAEEENPPAREVARKTLEAARGLEEVHRQRVVHRDVKGTNLLVREADGHVVLVDFGASGHEGAPPLTRYGLAPGTHLYRSPEAVRFHLDNTHRPGARPPHGPSDDLYALGVVLYALLTDRMPFRENIPEVRIQELYEEILHRVPAHPSDLNPRVPRRLGDLCLRLLAKRPEDRPASASELCGALEAALGEADVAWEVPLFPSRAAARREDGPAREQSEAEAEREWVMEQPGQQRGRGRPPPPEEPPPPPPVDSLAGPAPFRATSSSPLAWSGPLVLLVLVLLGLLLSSRVGSISGHEVAPPSGLPEADAGAAPSVAATPAPVVPTTPREEDTHVKNPKTSPKQEEKRPAPASARRAAAALALCTAANGCTAVPVRPPPTDCPPENLRVMESTLGIRVGDMGHIVVEPFKSIGADPIAVPRGKVESKLTSGLGKVPEPEEYLPRLHGELLFGTDRVYGRYTELVLPKGERYPVCLQLHDRRDGTLGMPMAPGSGTGAALILNGAAVKAVNRFE